MVRLYPRNVSGLVFGGREVMNEMVPDRRKAPPDEISRAAGMVSDLQRTSGAL